MKFFVTCCYFLFWVIPLQKLKVCSVFGNLILSLLFGSYFGEAKNSVILSQNYSFEELMEKLILSNFLVKI